MGGGASARFLRALKASRTKQAPRADKRKRARVYVGYITNMVDRRDDEVLKVRAMSEEEAREKFEWMKGGNTRSVSEVVTVAECKRRGDWWMLC